MHPRAVAIEDRDFSENRSHTVDEFWPLGMQLAIHP